MIESLRSLNEIGLHFGTDKSSCKHGFLDFYQRFLDEIRYEKVTVLEIGVYRGESLRMWEEYFPNASIIAYDVDPNCLSYASDRSNIFLGDQSNVVQLLTFAAKYGPFDLVLDDGSHMWEHQITTLRCLYPFVRPGRFYILEDLDTSYGSYVDRFRGVATLSTSSYLQRLCDYIVADEQLNLEQEEDAFIRSSARLTEFVAFSKRTSLIRRKPE